MDWMHIPQSPDCRCQMCLDQWKAFNQIIWAMYVERPPAELTRDAAGDADK